MLPLVVMGSGGSPSEPRGSVLRRGAWSQAEDELLKQCIEKHGVGKWGRVPQLAGLNRCRKSCRLRWLNYLSPGIKRGSFAEDEEDLIIRLHKLLGNRWSLIAGRIPGRTANDVKNYWNSHLNKKVIARGEKKDGAPRADGLIKPQPQTIPSNWMWTMKPRANRSAEHQREESDTDGRPCIGEDHRAWAEDHILFDVETNHAGSQMEEDVMMMELQTRIGVEEDMVGYRDEEVVLEGKTTRESLLSDIDLWGEYALYSPPSSFLL